MTALHMELVAARFWTEMASHGGRWQMEILAILPSAIKKTQSGTPFIQIVLLGLAARSF